MAKAGIAAIALVQGERNNKPLSLVPRLLTGTALMRVS
jgi:hypothetical protein